MFGRKPSAPYLRQASTRLLLIFTVAIGCNKDTTDSARAAPAASFDEMLTKVLVPSCGFDSCHGSGAGYLRIHERQTEEEWLSMESNVFAGQLLVTPGDAGRSYLIHKMEGASTIAGDVMPPSGSISNARIQIVRSWIDDLD